MVHWGWKLDTGIIHTLQGISNKNSSEESQVEESLQESPHTPILSKTTFIN